MRKVSGLSLLLFSALAMAECSVLATKRAPLRGTTASTASACKRRQALDLPHDFAHLLRGHRDIFGDCENFHKNYLASAFAVWAPCFLNVRVSENSPSLWPTMFSVTNTGLKILPL